MSKRKVVTKNKKIYYISEYSGKYTVYRIDFGIIFDDKNNIGTTKTLDDALSIIKADSGSDIKSISWERRHYVGTIFTKEKKWGVTA